MTTRHNLSRAAEVYAGNGVHAGVFNTQKRAGARVGTVAQYSLGTPTVGAVDTLGASQSAAGAADLVLTAATTLDVPRNVTISCAADETGVVFTVTGTDQYGVALVENITGVNASMASGKKAFKTITSIATDGATTGNVTLGDGDVLGLPVRLNAAANLIAQHADATEESASSTIVAGVGTTATATTGDVRGTVNPNTTLDGSVEILVTMFANGTTGELLGGVAQYGG